MSIRFRCPCGQKLKTADKTLGKRAKCSKCDRWLRVPESDTYDAIADEVQIKEAAKTEAAKEKAPASEEKAPEDAKGHVVAADGNKAHLESVCGVLRDHGYYVSETMDGTQAVELIRKHAPDIAVLDVQLDNLGGFQVVKQIRDVANQLNKDVWKMPVVMTAGKVRGRDKQYAMSIGVQGYFNKPVNPAKLCSRVEKEIGKYRAS